MFNVLLHRGGILDALHVVSFLFPFVIIWFANSAFVLHNGSRNYLDVIAVIG